MRECEGGATRKRRQKPKNRKTKAPGAQKPEPQKPQKAPKSEGRAKKQKKIEEQERESLARWRVGEGWRGLARVGEGDFHDKLVTTSELRRKWWDYAGYR